MVSLVLVLPETAGDPNDADVEPLSVASPQACCKASTGAGTEIRGSGASGCASAQSVRTSAALAPCAAASSTKACPSWASPFTAMKRSPGVHFPRVPLDPAKFGIRIELAHDAGFGGGQELDRGMAVKSAR